MTHHPPSTRRDPRYCIHGKGSEIELRLGSHRTPVSAPVTAVSVAGLSFRLPVTEAASFPLGRVVDRVDVRIGGCVVSGSLTIRNGRTIGDEREIGGIFIPAESGDEERWMVLMEGLDAATGRQPEATGASERGFSLTKLLVVVAVIALVSTVAVGVGGPMLAREGMRADLVTLQSALQRGRVEAASRNRPCRVMINATDRRLLVVDGMGTSTAADDVILHRTRLSPRSVFASPNGSSAVTVGSPVGGWYAVTFDSDGSVDAGTGQVSLSGGDRFGRVSIYAGGGAQLAFWDGSRWYETGS